MRNLARLPHLDGVRGLAIWLVLWGHLSAPFVGQSPLELGLTKLAGTGWIGVDLFFILSSFLITSILLQSKSEGGPLRHFYLRRCVRILPLYYAYLLILFGAMPLLADQLPNFYWWLFHHQVYVWTHLTNILAFKAEGGLLPLVSHFWSLSVEEHFYLLWPPTVLLLSARGLERLCLVLIPAAVLTRILLQMSGAPLAAIMMFTGSRVDSLALGAIIALHYRHDTNYSRFAKRLGLVTLVAVCCFGSIAALKQHHEFLKTASSLLNRTVLSLSFASLLAATLAGGTQGKLVRLFTFSPLRFSGRLCYGLYLLQPLVLQVLAPYLPLNKWISEWGSVAAWAICFPPLFLLCHLIAWLSWNLFEKRFLALVPSQMQPETRLEVPSLELLERPIEVIREQAR